MGVPRCMEAELVDTQHVLVLLSGPAHLDFELFGTIVTLDDLAAGFSVAGKTLYLAGDIARARTLDLTGAARVFVIGELAHGYADEHVIGLGQVPVRVGGLGVLFRQFFDDAAAIYRRICAEHAFQALTESVKPSKAHRTGIYLTPVTREAEALRFHLLRCSTNLAGPTENFCATDRYIVDALNCEAATLFRGAAPLNHVLAQIYTNTPASVGRSETKAKISAHADKTKDMPVDGIMAFCTFYDGFGKLAPQGAFDHGHKGKSGLTKLRFRLKEPTPGLVPELSVTLSPGSVFFMPLSTNRLYTHEIQSSILNADLLPTRLGYVVRCSKTEAIHDRGTTYLLLDGTRVPLEPPTPEGMAALRALYAAENQTTGFIDYGDRFRFSLNEGDYRAPDEKRD